MENQKQDNSNEEFESMKQRLQATADLQSAIMRSAIDCIIIMDGMGIVRDWNPASETTFGYTREEAIGRTVAELIIPPGLQEAHATALSQFAEKKEHTLLGKRVEVVGMRKDGSTLDIELAVQQVHSEAASADLIFAGYIRDISLRKQHDREIAAAKLAAERANAIKTQFLATMSHEIRTPINGMLGMTELLLSTELTAEQRSYSQTLLTCGEALMTLINDILDFSKIEAGKLVVEKIDYDLRTVVESALSVVAESAQSKGLELVSKLSPDLPAIVTGDPGRLRQILTNLVGNAIKFSERGHVVVTADVITPRPTRSGDETVLRFEVTDTGMGVPLDVQSRLFTAFTQADASMTRKFGGTGLGLAICKQLVHLMNGQIGVASKGVGHGSTFWFTARLPVRSVSPPMRFSFHSYRFLCCQENKELLAATLSYLASSGAAIVDTCTSTSRALELVRSAAADRQPYDCLVVDSDLQDGMSGIELCTAINELALPATPVVVLTCPLIESHLCERATAPSIAAKISRPIRYVQLLEAVAHALARTGDVHSNLTTPASSTGGTSNRSSSIPSAISPEMDATVGRQLRVLVAEDNPVNQRVVMLFLDKLAHSAVCVNNGQEAVDAMAASAEHPFDLVLMDCSMPIMDGFEATELIRRLEEPMRSVPIIATTANAMRGDRDKCLLSGMNGYLAKPFHVEALRQVINDVVTPDAHAHPQPVAPLQLPFALRDDIQFGSADHPAAQQQQHPHEDEPAEPAEPEHLASMPDSGPGSGSVTHRTSQEDFSLLQMQPFNLDAVNALADNDTQLVHELMELFLDGLQGHLESLAKCVEQTPFDAEVFGRITHTMKGSAGNVGCERLFALCAHVNQAARRGEVDITKARDYVKEIFEEARLARAAVIQVGAVSHEWNAHNLCSETPDVRHLVK